MAPALVALTVLEALAALKQLQIWVIENGFGRGPGWGVGVRRKRDRGGGDLESYPLFPIATEKAINLFVVFSLS